MTRTKVAGGLIGVVFGIVLSWTWMSDPDVVRNALLFKQSYLFEFFASAVATGALGLHVVKRFQRRAVLTGAPVGWRDEPPARRHVQGAVLFGIGWGVTGVCPAPIATQIGQGVPWAVFMLIGTVGGVYLFLRRGERELEPPADAVPVSG